MLTESRVGELWDGDAKFLIPTQIFTHLKNRPCFKQATKRSIERDPFQRIETDGKY